MPGPMSDNRLAKIHENFEEVFRRKDFDFSMDFILADVTDLFVELSSLREEAKQSVALDELRSLDEETISRIGRRAFPVLEPQEYRDSLVTAVVPALVTTLLERIA